MVLHLMGRRMSSVAFEPLSWSSHFGGASQSQDAQVVQMDDCASPVFRLADVLSEGFEVSLADSREDQYRYDSTRPVAVSSKPESNRRST
jgi:hypothetical protein